MLSRVPPLLPCSAAFGLMAGRALSGDVEATPFALALLFAAVGLGLRESTPNARKD